MNSPGETLRSLLDEPGHVVAVLGIPSALQGQIMGEAGVEAGFVGTGITFRNVTGLPDTGVASANECVTLGGHIARAVPYPVLLDGDTGHGGPDAVARLVRDSIREGLAGIRLDDQPIQTKRSTQSAGIEIVGEEEAITRYQAAVRARDQLDPTFIVMAQCYARDATNGSLEIALERMRLYREVGGVDWCQLESPHSRDEVLAARRAVSSGYCSVMRGKLGRPLSIPEHRELGLNAAWYTFMPSGVLTAASREFLSEFQRDGIEAWNRFVELHGRTLQAPGL